jgi:hypothetical protein
MKALSSLPRAAVLLSALLAGKGAAAAAPPEPHVAGPLVELKKAPVFTAPDLPLAKTWGVAIPVGTPFEVEKVYGRWIYGHPAPLAHMRPQDYSPSGWIFSRSLVLPGDADTLLPSVVKQSRDVLFHARSAWKKLKLGTEPLYSPLDVFESMVLSKKTLAAFSQPEESPPNAAYALFPEARASDEPAPMGLTGTDLSFLDQEIKVVETRKRKEARAKESKRAHVPSPPPLDDQARTGLLGRYMLERYLELPPLSLEEVDGYVYMRATAMRALNGCPARVRDYWKTHRWGFFRVFHLKSRPEIKHPWFEIALPGGYFAVSGKAIDVAGNEAELAFLLVRQLVRVLRVKRPAVRLAKAGWPEALGPKAEELWDLELKAQSTKDAEGYDVADEIAVDAQAIECISNAGYRPMAAIAYLRKLALHRDEPWAAWYAQHAIGLDYRIEQVTEFTKKALAEEKFPEGQDSRQKRFASAVKQWNLLP